jgi:hypothetical protein
MTKRFTIVGPITAAMLSLALSAALLTTSGCTTYRDPDDYEASYDDEPIYDDADDTYVDFEELEYWGQWLELSPYGTVWRHTVVMDWQPCTNGQWMWTNLGWTWVSYEPFGWATYHYGWWVWDFAWGWVWIPDYEWHPARVDWIIYDDYIAWAPLPPPDGFIGDPWTWSDCDCWHVVPIDHFTDDNVGRHVIRYKDRRAIRERSSIIYHEPDVTLVQTGTNRTIVPIKIELVRASKDARVEKIRLPREQARAVARHQQATEKAIRPVERRTQPPALQESTRDNPPPEPPARMEQPKKEPAPPTRVERPAKEKEKPKKEEPRKREPEKKPQKEKPRKEEPKKEEPKKDEPEKEKPATKTPSKRPQKR